MQVFFQHLDGSGLAQDISSQYLLRIASDKALCPETTSFSGGSGAITKKRPV